MDIFNSYDGKWMYIKSENEKYIGRYVGNNIDEDINNNTVKLQPAFYYISEYVQDQNGNIARQLMITPIELCVGFDSLARINDVSFVMMFDEMSAEDRHQFEKAVRQGVDNMYEAKAAKAGITLETNMPSKKSNGILLS